MKVEALQERILVMPEKSKERENFEKEMKKWYWKDEELLELLSEIKRAEEHEALRDKTPKVQRKGVRK